MKLDYTSLEALILDSDGPEFELVYDATAGDARKIVDKLLADAGAEADDADIAGLIDKIKSIGG